MTLNLIDKINERVLFQLLVLLHYDVLATTDDIVILGMNTTIKIFLYKIHTFYCTNNNHNNTSNLHDKIPAV